MAASANPEARKNIAVLGGGVTGLTAAHYLTREFPNAHVTIYEGSGRLGGWVKSTKVDVGSGHAVLEQGPRTLRPHTVAGGVTQELICNLGLQDELLITPKDSVAARSRFVYYPDHLVKLPGPGQSPFDMAWTMIDEAAFTGIWKVFGEFTRDPRDPNIEDESVGAFLSRRFGGPELVDNLASAGLHGIYAGDIWQLSALSLMPSLWRQEAVHDSLMNAFLDTFSSEKHVGRTMEVLQDDLLLRNELLKNGSLVESLNSASVYTFKTGIGALTDSLTTDLMANENVEFKSGENVSNIRYDSETDNVTIQTATSPASSYAHIISTIPARALSHMPGVSLPSLTSIHAVTVMVVNLFYTESDIMPEPGFGYLIPRSIPFEQNPECALGVVFDTYSSLGQDTPGTKITVMLGGHWWDSFSKNEYPDEEEGAAMAKAVLRRHLGASFDPEPEKVLVGLQRECIPQYTVGHTARLKTAHQGLMEGFKGRMSVAGSSYGGVGLNDCVRGARDAVMALKPAFGELPQTTGLESFVKPQAWVKVGTNWK